MANDLLSTVKEQVMPKQERETSSNVEAEGKLNFRIDMPSALIQDIQSKFHEAERARQPQERQWIKNVNSYRGKDTHDAVMRQSEKSKVYIRTTTVKVKAAFSQIIEALFSDTKFPIGISSTPIPDGVSEFAHLRTDMEADVQRTEETQEGPIGGIGFAGDGFKPAPGSTTNKPNFLGGLEEEYKGKDGNSVMAEGKSRDGSTPTIQPAKELAHRMEKVIHDQLEETKARTELRKAIFECCLLGTGIMKGPFNTTKTLHNWEEGEYKPVHKRTCMSSMTSAWDFYPDPNASTADEMEWAIERHTMNHAQVRDLKNRPHFNKKAIDNLLMLAGNYEPRSYEHAVDSSNHTESKGRLYEVLEYWGYVPTELLKEYEIKHDLDIDSDMVQINAWISGKEVLRVVVNPFIPQRIPYYVFPYEADPYSIWGTGVPESMEDTQALMNGFMRLAIDNLALAGNLVFDIDESMLVPGQPMEIFPGKIFARQAGGVGQAIHGISFPNTAPANMDMFRQVRQLADESTGIPSFAHGQTGVMSPTRTASGMSMLLNNASLNNKTVIRNIDDYLLKPWGEAYYRWNLQFNEDVSVKGDLQVKATGSSSMQMKEVRSARLNTFLQLAANPNIAPFIKLPTVIRELAISMEMDPDEILNNPDEALIYAKIIGAQGQQASAAPAMPGLPGGVPTPNEQGFTGNNEGLGNLLGINGMEGMTGEGQQF